MTTIENRPNTALLVIDVQNGVVGGAYERDTVVATVGTVVEKARAAEVRLRSVLTTPAAEGPTTRSRDSADA